MQASNIFRTPSFFKGVARTLDLFGKLDGYRYSEDSDSELIQRDWRNTGQDLKQVLRKYAKKSYY